MKYRILLVEILLLALYTRALLQYYCGKNVGRLVWCAVFLSWYLGFIGLILLPRDLSSDGSMEMHEDLLNVWQFAYWTTFLMSWCILPYLLNYSESGEFDTRKRMLNSLRLLVRNYAVMAIMGVMVMLYLLTVNHLSFTSLSGLVMAAGNTYGLLWIIALLGFGLVDVPRKLWWNSSREETLNRLFFRAVQYHDDRVENTFVHEEELRQIQQLCKRAFQNPNVDYDRLTKDQTMILKHMRTIMKVAELPDPQDCVSAPYSFDAMSAAFPDEPELVSLHSRIRKTMDDIRRSEQLWYELCIKAKLMRELVLEKELSKEDYVEITGPTKLLENVATYIKWKWQRHYEPIYLIVLFGITFLFSVSIGICELTMAWDESMSPLGNLLLLLMNNIPALQAVILVIVLYMSICIYRSLFTLKLFGAFILQKSLSNEVSLLKNGIYQCRLQFSLCYNFLLLLNNQRITNSTALHALLRHISLVKFFGTDFNVYAPVLIIILAFFTYFNGYAKLIQFLGFEQYENYIPDNYEHKAKIKQGEIYVNKGLEKILGNSSEKQRKGKKSYIDKDLEMFRSASIKLLDDDIHP